MWSGSSNDPYNDIKCVTVSLYINTSRRNYLNTHSTWFMGSIFHNVSHLFMILVNVLLKRNVVIFFP
jgi:hypothetical protein